MTRRGDSAGVTRQVDELRSGVRPLDDCPPETAELLELAAAITLDGAERLTPERLELGRRALLAAITAPPAPRGREPRLHWTRLPAWLRTPVLAGGLLATMSGGAVAYAAHGAAPDSPLFPVQQVARLVLPPLPAATPTPVPGAPPGSAAQDSPAPMAAGAPTPPSGRLDASQTARQSGGERTGLDRTDNRAGADAARGAASADRPLDRPRDDAQDRSRGARQSQEDGSPGSPRTADPTRGGDRRSAKNDQRDAVSPFDPNDRRDGRPASGRDAPNPQGVAVPAVDNGDVTSADRAESRGRDEGSRFKGQRAGRGAPASAMPAAATARQPTPDRERDQPDGGDARPGNSERAGNRSVRSGQDAPSPTPTEEGRRQATARR